jgi:hypothetical protein
MMRTRSLLSVETTKGYALEGRSPWARENACVQLFSTTGCRRRCLPSDRDRIFRHLRRAAGTNRHFVESSKVTRGSGTSDAHITLASSHSPLTMTSLHRRRPAPLRRSCASATAPLGITSSLVSTGGAGATIVDPGRQQTAHPDSEGCKKTIPTGRHAFCITKDMRKKGTHHHNAISLITNEAVSMVMSGGSASAVKPSSPSAPSDDTAPLDARAAWPGGESWEEP